MKKKIFLAGVLLALAAGFVIAEQTQSWWRADGAQCFSYAGVEYVHETTENTSKKTTFTNHNGYSVTVLYSNGSTQQSQWIAAGGKAEVKGHVTVNNCTKSN